MRPAPSKRNGEVAGPEPRALTCGNRYNGCPGRVLEHPPELADPDWRTDVPNLTCVVPGCPRCGDSTGPRSMCTRHRVLAAAGLPLDTPKQRNRKPATCTVEGCDGDARRPGAARGWCKPHYRAWAKHGDPLTVGSPGAPVVETPGYSAVHIRLRSKRGPASGFACVDCSGPASDWSYEGGAPTETMSEFGAFTTDLGFYRPRCRSCHLTHDYADRRAATERTTK